MKHLILFVLVGGLASASVFAQVDLPQHDFAVGSWVINGNRVYQNDEKAALAKANLKVSQKGAMIYEFTARYEGGVEDGHGGFGLHVFSDTAFKDKSWGNGNSLLLWLNYDEAPLKNSDIPAGLSAQVYRSTSNSSMELLYSIDLNKYLPLLTARALSNPIAFKIYANGDTGEFRIYDPSDPAGANYYAFTLDKKYLPLKGDWVVMRTNSIKLSFAPVAE